MAPLTVEELQQHPEYNHTIWDLKPTKKGKVPVAKDRGGPINLAYEVHGSGDRHLVVSCSIFGLCKLQRPTSKTGTHCSSICHAHNSRFLPGFCAVARCRHVLFQSHGPSHNRFSRLMFLNPRSLSSEPLSTILFCPSIYVLFSLHLLSMPRAQSPQSTVLMRCSGVWVLAA
jgi:hypothetical protein